MSITIRDADLEADQEIILCTLANNLPLGAGRIERFHWLYNRNPAGPAHSWVAIDSGTQKCIGVAAAFPRRMSVYGSLETAWVLGDFCLDQSYRSLGPALMLQRKCLEGIHSAGVPFFYDFPSNSMLRVYTRLGIEEFGKIVRFAKPLRVDRIVEDFVTNRGLANLLTKVGNFFIKSINRKPEMPELPKIIPHHDRFGREFSKLADEVVGNHEVCVLRSAEYLNWRYRENPLYEYEVLTAYQNGRLVGYLIYRKEGEYVTLVDVFGFRDPSVIICLLQSMLNDLYDQGIISVNAPILEGQFLGEILRSHGFKSRETFPFVVYGLERLAKSGRKDCGGEWFIMEGDRDS